MSKPNRELVFKKYNGHCAYCGEILENQNSKMHIDHLIPIKRKHKYNSYTKKWIKQKNNQDHDNIDNLMPSCPSCNTWKHTMSLEQFRKSILGQLGELPSS